MTVGLPMKIAGLPPRAQVICQQSSAARRVRGTATLENHLRAQLDHAIGRQTEEAGGAATIAEHSRQRACRASDHMSEFKCGISVSRPRKNEVSIGSKSEPGISAPFQRVRQVWLLHETVEYLHLPEVTRSGARPPPGGLASARGNVEDVDRNQHDALVQGLVVLQAVQQGVRHRLSGLGVRNTAVPGTRVTPSIAVDEAPWYPSHPCARWALSRSRPRFQVDSSR
jgi:hypothetical protein